jgi:hypothetical protein
MKGIEISIIVEVYVQRSHVELSHAVRRGKKIPVCGNAAIGNDIDRGRRIT